MLDAKHRASAVKMFAQGYSRPLVVGYLIEEFPELAEQSKADDTFQNRMADTLKTCDPTSPQFAEKKYLTLYETHKQAYKEILAVAYQNTLMETIHLMQDEIATLKELRDHWKHWATCETEAMPMDLKDKENAVKTYNDINKRLQELQGIWLDRAERILFNPPNPTETTE